MRTPIAAFLAEYSKRQATRLHMPGHKGEGENLLVSHDITEISGADVLYSPTGIILESERLTSALFGTARTVYSTEGSSLSLKAMLALVTFFAAQKGEKPLILAARNVHKSFVYASALLDFDTEWIYGDSLISTKIEPHALREKLAAMKKKPTAFYVTSPDYLGNLADVASLSKICREFGVLFLVDNAHGAYLKFLPRDIHPITLGADMCCDSAHKTLPALTGAGYLHISKDAPSLFLERVDEAMSLFASTSPSYLILESLDLLTDYLNVWYREKLSSLIPPRDSAVEKLRAHGFCVLDTEPLKISIATKSFGYTGDAVAEILEKSDVFVEFHDSDFITVMLSPEVGEGALTRFTDALLALERLPEITAPLPKPPRVERVMSPRSAAFSSQKTVKTRDAVGCTFAAASISCPPAVPILVSGELLTKEAIDALLYYGIEEINVVK